jgi:hypothetical protein
MDIIYDIEVFPNCFTLTAMDAHLDFLMWQFEISDRRDDSEAIREWVKWLSQSGGRMIGFNNVGFDYPILHMLLSCDCLQMQGELYQKCQEIIFSQDNNRWVHMVYPSNRKCPQVDLYLIHHFDNRAKATSLKTLEFNMRMDNVSDLPFEVGTMLNSNQIDVLLKYNLHDVVATRMFYHESIDAIRFREALTKNYGVDFLNFNDTKIGKQFFVMMLEMSGVVCYDVGPDGRIPRQTKRNPIVLANAILPDIHFQHFEFNWVLEYLREQEVHETLGVFKDLIAKVNGFEFVFGLGGIHGSVKNMRFASCANYVILDIDVTSFYPMLAIQNRFYPEHLGLKFCDVYQSLFDQRAQHAKGTTENAMLKLALNGVYGDSNNPYSVFFDPLYTMKTTLNGQFLLCMLAERLLDTIGVSIIQINTDGMTLLVNRDSLAQVQYITADWERFTRLSLEQVEYDRMIVADVNNYIAVGASGKIKSKGKFMYKREWHQNHSALVVPKVAEMFLVQGVSIKDTIVNWPDRMDFMLRAKVNRGSTLVKDNGETLPRTCRYYVSQGGNEIFKMMPPLPKNGKDAPWRKFSIELNKTVCVCNDMCDAVLPIDYGYYINEVEKMVLGIR